MKADGTIDYDPSLDGVYSGRGTTTLTLRGVPFTLDATSLTEQQMQVPGVTGDFDTKTAQNLVVAPGTYAVYTAAGAYITAASGTAATLTVKADGTFAYDASLAKVYTLPTPGTTKIPSFPLTLDATSLTERQMQVPGVTATRTRSAVTSPMDR